MNTQQSLPLRNILCLAVKQSIHYIVSFIDIVKRRIGCGRVPRTLRIGHETHEQTFHTTLQYRPQINQPLGR